MDWRIGWFPEGYCKKKHQLLRVDIRIVKIYLYRSRKAWMTTPHENASSSLYEWRLISYSSSDTCRKKYSLPGFVLDVWSVSVQEKENYFSDQDANLLNSFITSCHLENDSFVKPEFSPFAKSLFDEESAETEMNPGRFVDDMSFFPWLWDARTESANGWWMNYLPHVLYRRHWVNIGLISEADENTWKDEQV